jgi:hypothetical protein
MDSIQAHPGPVTEAPPSCPLWPSKDGFYWGADTYTCMCHHITATGDSPTANTAMYMSNQTCGRQQPTANGVTSHHSPAACGAAALSPLRQPALPTPRAETRVRRGPAECERHLSLRARHPGPSLGHRYRPVGTALRGCWCLQQMSGVAGCVFLWVGCGAMQRLEDLWLKHYCWYRAAGVLVPAAGQGWGRVKQGVQMFK